MKNLILLWAILFSQITFAELPILSLSDSLDESVALVFNDTSQQLYGDLHQNKFHIKRLCKALDKIGPYGPKVIFFDFDLRNLDIKCLLKISDKHKLNFVVPEYKSVFGKLSPEQESRIKEGDPGVQPYDKTKDGGIIVLGPNAFPFAVPAYFSMLVMSSSEKELREINLNWVRYIRLLNFSERNITKVSYQGVLNSTEHLKKFRNKYVFVGVDQDKYDSFLNAKREIINGVFFHVQFLAAYRMLQKLKPTIPPRTPIYFNNN